MHTPSLDLYMQPIYRGDWEAVSELMLASAHKLAQAGADFLICPDNTIHQAMHRVLPQSPLPWLHIAEVVAAEAASRGFRRVGVLGTRWLVDSEVYPQALSDADIAAAITEALAATGAKAPADMGKVMGVLKGSLAGRADMSKVSALVKAKLSAT